jgi:hypothetical protein
VPSGLIAALLVCTGTAKSKDEFVSIEFTPAQFEKVIAAHNDPLPELSKLTEEICFERLYPPFQARAKINKSTGEWSQSDVAAKDYARWASMLAVSQANMQEIILNQLSTPAAQDFAPQVKSVLRAKDPVVVRAAMRALKAMGITDHLPGLLKHAETEIRGEALAELIATNAPESFAAVLSFLSEPSNEWDPWKLIEKSPQIAKHAREIAGLLAGAAPVTRLRLLNALRYLKANGETAAVLQLLDPGQPGEVIVEAIETLQALNASNYFDRIPALLSPSLPREVHLAALGVLRQPADLENSRFIAYEHLVAAPEARKHAGAVAALLAEENPPEVVSGAIKTLGIMRAREYSNMIARWLVSDQTDELVEQAVETLGDLEAGEHAVAVARFVSDGSSELSLKALKALGKMRAVQYADRISHLIRERGWPYDGHRIAAALEALGHMNATGEVETIQNLMRQTSSLSLKAKCASILAQWGQMPQQESICILETALARDWPGDDWWSHRELRDLLTLFFRHGPDRGLPYLLRYAGGDFRLKWIAMDAVRSNEYNIRAAEVACFLDAPEPAIRSGALDYLMTMERFEFGREVTSLLDLPGDESTRAEARLYLAKTDPSQAINHILPLLDSAQPEWARLQALSCIKNVDRNDVLAAVTACLNSGEPGDIRIQAIDVLTSVRAPGLTELLTPLLAAKESGVRIAVLNALRSTKALDAVPLMRPLLGDPDAHSAAALALVELTEDRDPGDLSEWLQHPADIIRLNTVSALPSGTHWAARYRHIVASFLRDENAALRMAGFQALTRIGFGDELPGALRHLLKEDLTDFIDRVRALRDVNEPASSNGYPYLVEAAHRYFSRRADILYAAYMLYGEQPKWSPLLCWLGNRSMIERPAVPADAEAVRDLLTGLRGFMDEARTENCSKALFESGVLAADLVNGARWSPSDADWLYGLAEEMQKYPDLKGKAAAIRTVAKREYDRHPLHIALRWGLIALAVQPLFWLVVLLLYPHWSFAQRLVWQPAVRRIAGLGWVGPLLVRVPFLRVWLWRPFQEALVPPTEVQTFDEWTFFDSVRIRKAGSAEDSLPALPTLQSLTGSAVLQGVSGLGKTTLLQALVASASTPVAFLRAADCREGFLTTLRNRLPIHARNDPNFLRALIVKGSPAIFIDAVHEAPPAVQAQLTEEINALKGGRFILTAQPVAWHPPQDASVWEIEPLRPQDIAPFLLKQGTAAIEAAGSHALPDKWKDFKTRVESFLDELKDRPLDDPRAEAIRRMLRNPMEAVLAAELLAAGETPDPARLLAQRLEHFTEEYAAQYEVPFPSESFAAHLVTWRLTGAPLLSMMDFENVAEFLAKHRLLRKQPDADGWRFRHDKIADWFLAPAFADAADPVLRELKSDVRFTGVRVAAM